MPKPKAEPKRPPAPDKPLPPKDAAAALAELRSEIDALPPRDRRRKINTDVPRAVSIAMGAAPRIMKFAERAKAELPLFRARYMERIQTYALAAWYTHLVALPGESSEDAARSLLDEAGPLREAMLVAADALVHAKLFDGVRIAKIRAGSGNIDKASDLVALAACFAERWDAIKNKTALEWPQVERAAQLGPLILVALGERGTPASAKAEDVAELNLRAFSLFVKAYSQSRRAITFLTWEEEEGVDEVAPSLYARGGGRKGKSADEAEDDDAGDAAAEDDEADGAEADGEQGTKTNG
jgi:hypothetical protein